MPPSRPTADRTALHRAVASARSAAATAQRHRAAAKRAAKAYDSTTAGRVSQHLAATTAAGRSAAASVEHDTARATVRAASAAGTYLRSTSDTIAQQLAGLRPRPDQAPALTIALAPALAQRLEHARQQLAGIAPDPCSLAPRNGAPKRRHVRARLHGLDEVAPEHALHVHARLTGLQTTASAAAQRRRSHEPQPQALRRVLVLSGPNAPNAPSEATVHQGATTHR